MSVAPLHAEELALFSATITHLSLLPFAEAVKLSALISRGNAAAWSATYSDEIEIVDADEIEAIALRKLAAKDFTGHFGPLAYNMVANSGRAFAGIFHEVTQSSDILEHIQVLEKAAKKFIESEERKQRRAEEDAASFDDIARQPIHSADEVRQACRDAGMQRVIYATFNCDESDRYTDYWGGRTVRTIVLGFGKGKRENFKQLRKAAGMFPPTAHMGPDRNIWTVEAKREPNDYTSPRVMFRDEETGRTREFSTKAEAEAAVAELIATHEECREDYQGVINFPWYAKNEEVEYHSKSLENRENYSMGGGNYLGHDRYDGWKVQSVDVDWNCGLPSEVEWFKAEGGKGEAKAAKPKRAKRGRKAKVEVVAESAGVDAAGAIEVGCMAEDWV